MTKMKLIIEKINENAIIPTYGSRYASGMDLYSIENVEIHAGQTKVVKTGLRVKFPHGYEMQIRPRSGLAAKQNLTVLNTPGTIDSKQ